MLDYFRHLLEFKSQGLTELTFSALMKFLLEGLVWSSLFLWLSLIYLKSEGEIRFNPEGSFQKQFF
ncbi:MAG: hypothetical protein A3J06_04835 [Candidatus Moranbacteria bacterium RIFCSPLOWO2_02_FULL_48_19]|nr:MAG: hypothetical protein A3J06_04835 [Candidatus Moranbacteria bacterium RIFCSPLOWO2_02_FULL_48_19]